MQPDSTVLLLQLLGDLEERLQSPLQSTKRIKYKCFDVSPSYLLLGATSGALYVFRRSPCSFHKIIPSTEGAITCVSISPDEAIFAFATVKGSIGIVPSDSVVNVQTYTDFQGSTIAGLKWSSASDELFVGDASGRVSVLVFLNFISKTVLKARCAALMQLDSPIEQMDHHQSGHLLVSTQTRSYVCDTSLEHYRQVGQRLRSGGYGGCFYRRGEQEAVKVLCARPGRRIWEANLEGAVLSTRQFSGAELPGGPAPPLLALGAGPDGRLGAASVAESISARTAADFGRLAVVLEEHVVSFRDRDLFVLDGREPRLRQWLRFQEAIRDVRAVRDLVYVWTSALHVLVLVGSVGSLMARVYQAGQYRLCGDLCHWFREELLAGEMTVEMGVIKGLQSVDGLEPQVRQSVQSVLQKVAEEDQRTQTVVARRLDNGIHVVDNAYAVKVIATQPCKLEETDDFKVLLQEFNIVQAGNPPNERRLAGIFAKHTSLEDVIELLVEFENQVAQSGVFCAQRILHFLSTADKFEQCIQTLPQGCDSEKYIVESFKRVNPLSVDNCQCGFPLPLRTSTASFQQIGSALLAKYLPNGKLCHDLCTAVPTLWPSYLQLQLESDQFEPNLPLLAQLCSAETIQMYAKSLTFDHWHELVRQVVLLSTTKRCRNCEQCLRSTADSIPLAIAKVGQIMAQSIGGQNAINVLLEFADGIPKGSLDLQFYQMCIQEAYSSQGQIETEIESALRRLKV